MKQPLSNLCPVTHPSLPGSALSRLSRSFRVHTQPTAARVSRFILPAVLGLLTASTTACLAAPSLGGPIEQPARVQLVDEASRNGAAGNNAAGSSATANIQARSTPAAGLVAQAPRGMGGAVEENPGATSPTVIQEPLPVDAGLIRRLKVAGRTIDEAPRRVGNVEILAPFVSELSGLGASATRVAPENVPGNINTPTEDQIFQINLTQGAPIVLIVGKEIAYVNRIEQPLRAAPLVIKGRIWLPVFSLAPLLGAAPRMQSDGTLHLNPTVQSVELFPVKGMLALTIKTSAPLAAGSVQMGTLEDPPKLYLDFPGYSMGFDAANSQGERMVSGGMESVQKVRAGLFQDFPDTTRVVLDLKTRLTAIRQPMPDPTLFALVLGDPNRPIVSTMTAPTGGSLRGLTIVVDAGHGGHDHGALGSKSREKDHALDIARRLRDILVQQGATVHMTRDGDYFISLQGRVDFAHARNADIFFSVHINSFRSSSTGTQTFYYSAKSQALAREVQNELVKATGLTSRGITQARFYVIRNTRMPSILTETAFISNPKEEKLLMSAAWRDGVARHMAQGIINYVDRYMRRSSM